MDFNTLPIFNWQRVLLSSGFVILLFLHMFFHKIKHCVQPHGNDAQDYNGHQHPGKLKSLAAVDNKITKTFSCADKFTDDHTYQTETDIYFHNTDDQRNGSWQNDFCQLLFFVSAKGFDEFQFIRISLTETGIQIDNRAKDSNGHTGHNDSTFIRSKPYNKKRRKSRFRQAVMQIIETTASLSKAVLLYSHMVSHGLIFSHLLKILYW